MVKFNKHHVTNGIKKARIFYSLDNHVSRQPCVTLYAKDYSDDLQLIIKDGYVNNTDIITDYIEPGLVRMFADHPLYAAARAKAELISA